MGKRRAFASSSSDRHNRSWRIRRRVTEISPPEETYEISDSSELDGTVQTTTAIVTDVIPESDLSSGQDDPTAIADKLIGHLAAISSDSGGEDDSGNLKSKNNRKSTISGDQVKTLSHPKEIEEPEPLQSGSSSGICTSNMVRCFNRAQALIQRRKRRWPTPRRPISDQSQYLERLLDQFKSSNLRFGWRDSTLLPRRQSSRFMRLQLIADLREEFGQCFIPVKVLETQTTANENTNQPMEGRNAIPAMISAKLILVYHWLPLPKRLWTKDSVIQIHPDWLMLTLEDHSGCGDQLLDRLLLTDGHGSDDGHGFRYFILNGFNVSKEQ